MELRNQYVIYIFAAILAVVFILRGKNKTDRYNGGKKVTGMSYIEDDPYYKKRLRTYKVLSAMVAILCILSIVASVVILARPYSRSYVEKENHNRDIMLCLDISTSVDELNLSLVENLKSVVNELKGERFGIVIFNTSPVLLVPLTDDYEYVNNTLDELARCLTNRIDDDYSNDEWMYLQSYLETGTLVGNEKRGSSLIGDGLAGACINFDNPEAERTRIVIFATDNDIQGEPYYTLSEAASLCADNKIIVFGIGTKEMTSDNSKSMESAVRTTGGSFYIEEESGTVKSIINDINKQEKSLIKGNKELIKTDIITIPFIILMISISLMYMLASIIKK